MTPALPTALERTSFHFPGQTGFYQGKVRDVYTIADTWLVMVVTDRISAFDVVLPRAIPFKGQVLNQVASRMMHATRDIVSNWIHSVPDPIVTIGRKCAPFKVEMVIRGYLAGHAWRQYREGRRLLCGVSMPEGMRENERFPEPIITPTTKASEGHDEDISREEILKRRIVSAVQYEELERITRALFRRGTELAAQRGLLLVDTKYEFGLSGDTILLIDEIHTPDSSRYFYADGYESRLHRGEPQKQLSKEFVREWLIANHFQGKEGEQVPAMDDDRVMSISDRYIELYETLTGEPFVKGDTSALARRVERNVLEALRTLS